MVCMTMSDGDAIFILLFFFFCFFFNDTATTEIYTLSLQTLFRAAGSSPGIQLETIVNVLGLSGLRNAYRSVLSAVGSSEISGASRWLDAVLALGARRPTNNAVSPAAATRRNIAY